MTKDNVRIPSGMGGLVSFNESESLVKLSPVMVVVLIVAVVIFVMLLHLFSNVF